MKAFLKLFAMAAFFSGLGLCQAQQVATNQASVPSPTPYAIVTNDANSRVWERTVYEKGANGQITPQKQSYTELASGLNHLVNGQWVASKEEIDILPDGSAAATNGQHQVYFPANIYNGQIKMVMPDGQSLQSQPLGLSYDDGTNTVMLAELTNSVGELVSSNQVIYPNAFVGINADLEYTYTKAGFEQDVILHQQPLTPGVFNLNLQNTKLQMLTALAGDLSALPVAVGVSQPKTLSQRGLTPGTVLDVVSSRRVLPARHLVVADSGRIKLAMGNQPVETTGSLALDYITVNGSKSGYVFQGDTTYEIGTYVSLGGTCTLEGGAVLKFPASSGGGISIANGAKLVSTAGPYHMAVLTSVNDNSVGESIGTGSPATGTDTYLSLDGSAMSVLNYLRIEYAGTALQYVSGGSADTDVAPLDNCQILHCGTVAGLLDHDNANNADNTLEQDFENTLISNCGTVVGNINSDYYASSIKFGGVNMTVDQVTSLIATFSNDSQASYSELVNSIVTGVSHQVYYQDTSTGVNLMSIACYITSGSGSGVYQSRAGGNYYLANNTYRGQGTTSIDPTLLAELKTKTTYPPYVYANATITAPYDTIDNDFPTYALRDNGGTALDLGYHYDPLDYVFQNCTFDSSLLMIFTAGTAVGWEGYGCTLAESGDEGSLNFDGTADAPCYFVRCNTLQEADNSGDGPGITGSWHWISSSVTAIYTRFSAMGDIATFFEANKLNVTAYNCEFWDGQLGGSINDVLNLYSYNCLFDRSFIDFQTSVENTATDPVESIYLQNCTIHGGNLSVSQYIPLYVYDSAFDSTEFSVQTTSTTFRHNAFVVDSQYGYLPNCVPQFEWNGNTGTFYDNYGDVYVSTFNWQKGPLGYYYLPDDPQAQDGTLCIDAGDQPASDVGTEIVSGEPEQINLSYFTTQISQELECDTTVDIGYHYAPIIPYLLSPNAFWNTTLESDPQNNDPAHHPTPYNEGSRQAPFGYGYNGYYGSTGTTYDPEEILYTIAPPFITYWPIGGTMQLQTTVFIPSGTDLSQVTYSIAIDNSYTLTVNNQSLPPGSLQPNSGAARSSPQTFQKQDGTSYLQAGANNTIVVTITDDGGSGYGAVDYFSMIITTNACDVFPSTGPIY